MTSLHDFLVLLLTCAATAVVGSPFPANSTSTAASEGVEPAPSHSLSPLVGLIVGPVVLGGMLLTVAAFGVRAHGWRAMVEPTLVQAKKFTVFLIGIGPGTVDHVHSRAVAALDAVCDRAVAMPSPLIATPVPHSVRPIPLSFTTTPNIEVVSAKDDKSIELDVTDMGKTISTDGTESEYSDDRGEGSSTSSHNH
ncbi:uncharacterized protein STEHIDRAFT_111712 [Stereum hirsutum FP-91666 SS1]|uniref:uncharacterized protein n=1 Tax=Stereum hirsutum (strain FP-91666) TaxID=721885 RepID=UPI0004449228|nr:uncharacterized protein STEHIDRAFT_111712 [Stereum hirsutum FP-91666 SS1]EIM86195.1 hypothetical protein STEHIDRAFT_111712 [Stereum hirsutum FP-91666 SS1]